MQRCHHGMLESRGALQVKQRAAMLCPNGVSLFSALVALLCALAGQVGGVMGRSRQGLEADDTMQQRSLLRVRKGKCAQRGQSCKDKRFRRTVPGCCVDPDYECISLHRRGLICTRKRKPGSRRPRQHDLCPNAA